MTNFSREDYIEEEIRKRRVSGQEDCGIISRGGERNLFLAGHVYCMFSTFSWYFFHVHHSLLRHMKRMRQGTREEIGLEIGGYMGSIREWTVTYFDGWWVRKAVAVPTILMNPVTLKMNCQRVDIYGKHSWPFFETMDMHFKSRFKYLQYIFF